MTRRTPVSDTSSSDDVHNSADTPAAGTRLVRCPQCGGSAVFAPSNPYRPFCSARCRNIDFGDWADESFRLPAETDPSDSTDAGTHLQ